MQSSFFPPARLSTSFRSISSPSPADSTCALADPDTAIKPDDLGLLHPPLQIVLLSNDTRFCSLTRAFLQHAGFSVFTCTTSDRAESLFLNRSDLQLWIIDVQALGIEAVYFATRVREEHPSTPILLILADRTESRSLRQFLLHGWPQFTKPVDLSRMLSTINDVLAKTSGNSATRNFPSDSSPTPPEPFKSDWINELGRPNLTRMRN